MKTVSIQLPKKAAAELRRYVEAGWFTSEAEAVRAAVLEFVRRNRVELLDRFMREDIEWALQRKQRAA